VCARAISDALRDPQFVIPAAIAQHAASVDDHIWTVLIGGHQMGRGAGYIEYHYRTITSQANGPEGKT